ncbi:TniB family NTP-binding protein [Leptolyngbya sp. PL-A3]|uniref:TniB family NTP-binding protein n=1 Tax=Leptolyngbya sp. PL-A3 TaxID=2933911 RepID=UPI003297DA51
MNDSKSSFLDMTPKQRERVLSEMTYAQRRKLLHELVVKYKRFEDYLKRIKKCHEQFGYSSEPDCLFIGGDTGAGKSTLKDTYVKNFPIEETSEGTRIPVFSTSVPAHPTVKGLVSKLLFDIGDPHFSKGTEVSMTARLLGLLNDCGVELILLDELNFLIDRDSNKFLYSASEKIKEIITDSKIPIVGLGLLAAEEILSAGVNRQLSRRFSDRITLKPFPWFEQDEFGKPKNGHEFRSLLHYIESYLPLIEKSNLSVGSMARRIYYASDGNISYVMSLVKGGFDIAQDNGEEKLDLNTLAASFENRIRKEKPMKKNPFLEKDITLEELKDCQIIPLTSTVGATNRRNRTKETTPRASDILHT